MGSILERLSLLATSGGPRNNGASHDRFVVEDLMVALGWLSKPHIVELMMVKYGGHEISTPELLRMLHKRWQREASRYRLDGEQIDDLCVLALAEHLDDRRCTHCKGTGEIMKRSEAGGKLVVCPSCGGNGRYRYSGRMKATAVGVHKNTWRDRHLDRLYNRMLASLSAWESYGTRKMRAALK